MRLVRIKESKLYIYLCGSQFNSTLRSFIFHAFEFFCAEYLDRDVVWNDRPFISQAQYDSRDREGSHNESRAGRRKK